MLIVTIYRHKDNAFFAIPTNLSGEFRIFALPNGTCHSERNEESTNYTIS